MADDFYRPPFLFAKISFFDFLGLFLCRGSGVPLIGGWLRGKNAVSNFLQFFRCLVREHAYETGNSSESKWTGCIDSCLWGE